MLTKLNKAIKDNTINSNIENPTFLTILLANMPSITFDTTMGPTLLLKTQHYAWEQFVRGVHALSDPKIGNLANLLPDTIIDGGPFIFQTVTLKDGRTFNTAENHPHYYIYDNDDYMLILVDKQEEDEQTDLYREYIKTDHGPGQEDIEQELQRRNLVTLAIPVHYIQKMQLKFDL